MFNEETEAIKEAADVADPLQQTISLSFHCRTLQAWEYSNSVELIGSRFVSRGPRLREFRKIRGFCIADGVEFGFVTLAQLDESSLVDKLSRFHEKVGPWGGMVIFKHISQDRLALYAVITELIQ